MAQAYCVRCKEKKEIKNEEEKTIKGKGGTSKKALTGVCPQCGTKMFKFIKKTN